MENRLQVLSTAGAALRDMKAMWEGDAGVSRTVRSNLPTLRQSPARWMLKKNQEGAARRPRGQLRQHQVNSEAVWLMSCAWLIAKLVLYSARNGHEGLGEGPSAKPAQQVGQLKATKKESVYEACAEGTGNQEIADKAAMRESRKNLLMVASALSRFMQELAVVTLLC